MKKIQDAKEIYDRIEVPKELEQMLINTMKDHSKKNQEAINMKEKKRIYFMMKHTMVAAAGLLLFITVALNSSETFAKAAGDVPFIGGLAKVLTVRSYHEAEDKKETSVKVPGIQVDNSDDDTKKFVVDMNAEIDKIVEDYLTDAKSRLQADKDAFIATGGTEEDWKERDLNINVDYKVKYQKDNLLSLVLSADESWYGAYDLKYFYNLDLKNNKKLTLSDTLGEDYITIANESIIRQMKERVAEDPDYVYWGITDKEDAGMPGFTTVDENTKFYLNDAGKTVVCFDKYEVAPGFMGAQEFVIE